MTKCRKALALLLTVLMVFSLLPMTIAAEDPAESTQPVWPAEGSIKLDKDATAVEGQENLWEVTLGIQGKNYKTTSDVVLVIDCSGSMEGSRLTNTRKAAKAFGDKLLKEGSTTRIAIVTYTDKANAYNGGHFYAAGELDAFQTAVDAATYANGGTNQQAGLHKAQELLTSAVSTGKLKNIVILSDGEATYSYRITGTVTCTEDIVISEFLFWKTYATSNIDWTTANISVDYNKLDGDGSEFYFEKAQGLKVNACKEETDYITNGVATIWEANQAKAAGTTIFSVALQAGTNGENTLKACATDSTTGYFAIGKDDNVKEKLTSAFTAIAGSIAIAASDGVVNDPMGEYVKLSFKGDAPVITTNEAEYTAGQADVYISQGTATYDSANSTIRWEVGKVNEGVNPTMKYRITLKDDIQYGPNTVLDANGRTTFAYKNYQDEDTNAEFPIPKVTVDGGNILVHYYLVNSSGEPINEYGVVVAKPSLAKQIQDPAYFKVNGSTGLSYNTPYNVPKENIANYTYSGKYILNNGDLTTGDSVDVTLTAANSNQHVWFAYTQGFNVVHVTDGTAGTPIPYSIGDKVEGIYADGKFNLTACVTDGYLYGGAFSDEACTKAQSFNAGENAIAFTPEAGATYYIWEVDDDYLVPKSLSCWEHTGNSNNVDVMGFFVATPVDREYYSEVGFTVNNDKLVARQVTEKYVDSEGNTIILINDNEPVLYKKVVILRKDGSKGEYTIDKITNLKVGYIACASVDKTYWDKAGATIEFTPYWITLDGVKVTNATRVCRYEGEGPDVDENGAYSNLHRMVGKVGNDVSASSISTTSVTNQIPLTVFESFLGGVVVDSNPVDPEEPDEPVDPEEPVDPVDPEEPDDGTITVTVNDNGSVYELALLPGDISGEIEYLGASGCLFAGWYTDEAYMEPADFTYVTEDITIYAKYVSDAYLQVQYQQKRMSLRGGKATLISAVDSYAYAETGFVINGETLAVSPRDGSRQYYDIRWLFGNGVEKKSPILTTEISAGDYSVGDTIEVTPYWITMDGTTVYGASRTLTIARTGFKG